MTSLSHRVTVNSPNDEQIVEANVAALFLMFVYSTVIQQTIISTTPLKNSDFRLTNHETKQENVKKSFKSI